MAWDPAMVSVLLALGPLEFVSPLGAVGWAVLAGVPVGIIALYFLKLRRRPLQVPSTLLWKRSLEDLHVNSLFQRLRRNLLLFLQLAALLALIFAFARPVSFHKSSTSENTLLLIDHCRSHHIGYAFLPPVFADVPHLLVVERLGLLPMIRFRPTPLDGWGRIFKRLFDIAASVAGMLVLAIPMLIVAIVVVIDGGFPIFYTSKRVGEGGKKRIPVLKFRSMIPDADARKKELQELNHRKDGPLFKIKNDPRVTRVGKFLRRWSIDEWPQVFNVFVGHLSLVGPRPHLPEEVKLYDSYQRRVFAVKPGVTGLAQVSGRSDLTFGEEVALDLKYIEEWSLLRDLWVLWRTFIVVLGRKGAD